MALEAIRIQPTKVAYARFIYLGLLFCCTWQSQTSNNNHDHNNNNKLPVGVNVNAFTIPNRCAKSSISVGSRSLLYTKLYWGFFGRNKVTETPSSESKPKTEESSASNEKQKSNIGTTKVRESLSSVTLTPQEEAQRLRNEAAKSRLEAEKMDAELTLRKIQKLEKELKKQQMDLSTSNTTTTISGTTSTVVSNKKSTQDIQREIDVLLKKVRGPSEELTSTTRPQVLENVISSVSPTTTVTTVSSSSTSNIDIPILQTDAIWPKFIEPYDEKEFQALNMSLSGMPQFLLGTMALQVEMDMEIDSITNKVKPINITKLSYRLDQLRRQDFSFSTKPLPTFTIQQIMDTEKSIQDVMISNNNDNSKGNWWGGLNDNNIFFSKAEIDLMVQNFKRDPRYKVLWDTNDIRSLAQLVLEYQYYMDQDTEKETQQIMQLASEEEWLKPFISSSNVSGTNAVIESLYPPCTTKKDIIEKGTPSPIPTESQVQKLISDVLPKTSFKVNSKPEPVLGGYVIRGTTTLGGDAFIDQLDSVMDRSNIKNQMSVLFVNDFTILAEEVGFDSIDDSRSSMAMLPEDGQPILYVTAPNICRDPLPIRLSIVSACGLATSWYLSVYPFLLNSGIAARVDEQLAIADANMVPDLSWLSDLSVPLFASFMSIQLAHELGHLIIAGANGIKTSPPTFVPSIFTGITSAVTTFRTPPKNTAVMFDYSIAGPVAGMIASVLAIAVGCQLTAVTSDTSLFPALPLEILRQSTLGGGIIELILGNDSLSLPKAAIGTAAVAGMTVPLHPIAISGYISLIVNALAMLPIGTTDGGRVAVALFGRVFKISVASLALLGILFIGVFGGSDLFLFYFMFCVGFQRGNEIPARNEVDKLDLPRCFAAAAIYVISALALIPFQ